MTATATLTETLSITTSDATELLDWVGNNGIDSDVAIYEGGTNDYTGDMFFGFTADVLPTKSQVTDTLIRAAGRYIGQDKGTFIEFLNTNPNTQQILNAEMGIHDGYSAIQIVLWNVKMTEG
jgi:hypothetical protein